jgi:hypothetical protein
LRQSTTQDAPEETQSPRRAAVRYAAHALVLVLVVAVS